MRYLGFLIPLLLAILVGGCKTDPEVPTPDPEPDPIETPKTATMSLEIIPVVGSEAFSETGVYSSPTDRNYQFTRYRFLLSDLRLVRADGGEDVLTQDLYVDFFDNELRNDSGRIEGLTLTVPVTLSEDEDSVDYVGLRFAIGVPEPRNVDDPALWDDDHPLAYGRGMHWSWNTGYIFMQIEGKYDSTAQNNGDLAENFVYHPGRSELLREQDLNGEVTLAADQTTNATLQMDLAHTFFRANDQIDIAVENFTHSTPGSDLPLARRVIDNIAQEAFSFMP